MERDRPVEDNCDPRGAVGGIGGGALVSLDSKGLPFPLVAVVVLESRDRSDSAYALLPAASALKNEREKRTICEMPTVSTYLPRRTRLKVYQRTLSCEFHPLVD